MILRIWHRVKHDDYEVTERETRSPVSDVDAIRKDCGFWAGKAFIPWQSITYIQEISEDAGTRQAGKNQRTKR